MNLRRTLFVLLFAASLASMPPGVQAEGAAIASSECGGTVAFNCEMGGYWHCSPNTPGEPAKPDCSNGQWQYRAGQWCSVYFRPPFGQATCLR